MKTGKGVVKKYSREYNRTLKNGEKKKYTTKQIQITIPKHDDIYEDKEEVLIIPQSEIEEFKNLEDKVSALEIANYIYTNEIETTPKVNVEAFENEINLIFKCFNIYFWCGFYFIGVDIIGYFKCTNFIFQVLKLFNFTLRNN